MKKFFLAAMILAICVAGYSCTYKCVAHPPPGGYSYGQPGEKK